jgi:hypothetical protein
MERRFKRLDNADPARKLSRICKASVNKRQHLTGNMGGSTAQTIHFQNIGKGVVMKAFLEMLRKQRWDDHRYYHHSRINQTLHLVSALSFLTAYALLFTNPVAAALIGWLAAMVSRQVGHFFFEPKGFDEVNQATHEYKESIKVGYNLERKVVLLGIWALSPVVLYFDPTLSGIFAPTDDAGFVHRLGIVWLTIGAGGLLFRTLHLFFLKDVQTGLVWLTKILTDPFHDLMLYYKAPLYLLRGELIDPMSHKQQA